MTCAQFEQDKEEVWYHNSFSSIIITDIIINNNIIIDAMNITHIQNSIHTYICRSNYRFLGNRSKFEERAVAWLSVNLTNVYTPEWDSFKLNTVWEQHCYQNWLKTSKPTTAAMLVWPERDCRLTVTLRPLASMMPWASIAPNLAITSSCLSLITWTHQMTLITLYSWGY